MEKNNKKKFFAKIKFIFCQKKKSTSYILFNYSKFCIGPFNSKANSNELI